MSLISIFKMIHLLGVIMGFGGALLADLLILNRAILKPVTRETIDSIRSLSHIVFAGLGLLWVSGLILICLRFNADPNIIMNEKIWAKVAIVFILTMNGFIVHTVAIHHIKGRIGKQLFDSTQLRQMVGLTFVAAVSSASWAAPFVLGVASELNFTVEARSILSVYAVAIFVAWGMMLSLALAATRRPLISGNAPYANSSQLLSRRMEQMISYHAQVICREQDTFRVQIAGLRLQLNNLRHRIGEDGWQSNTQQFAEPHEDQHEVLEPEVRSGYRSTYSMPDYAPRVHEMTNTRYPEISPMQRNWNRQPAKFHTPHLANSMSNIEKFSDARQG